MYIEYPKYLYAKDGSSVIVKNAEEEKDLPKGYKDSPAASFEEVLVAEEKTSSKPAPLKIKVDE